MDNLKSEDDVRKAREQAVIDVYRPICLCNRSARESYSKQTRAARLLSRWSAEEPVWGPAPCGAARCGPMVRGMLGEEVETCSQCGWSILKGPPPLTCPRCGAAQKNS